MQEGGGKVERKVGGSWVGLERERKREKDREERGEKRKEKGNERGGGARLIREKKKKRRGEKPNGQLCPS